MTCAPYIEREILLTFNTTFSHALASPLAPLPTTFFQQEHTIYASLNLCKILFICKEMERYEIVKDIGSGNFGVAKLVRDKWSGELYAIKYIERGKKIDEHVQREIMNHRSLKHPNIIRFKEVFLTPTHLAIVMEYAAGGELFDRICTAGRFSEDEQICHRDLKLENTLLDDSPSPRLKICDFGYSKSSVFHSQPKSTVGTPAYIAPEVLSRKEYDGKRITISEMKKHPWFVKNLAIEFMEGEAASVQRNIGEDEDDYASQTMDETLAILQEARTISARPTKIFDDPFVGGSLDLDEIDTDEDVDDIDTSGDFVCAM
ncbi:hypothetical protein SASPL_135591 [Salvia splendens]|uniref:non-specific serine/threonine protein kinase n=1 Tax=Salvia splendens TaxID=180675 RepID=A0A8X8WY88_SALSN|nr:hypothetical protein SASPL_135591 [Salvia splendens]